VFAVLADYFTSFGPKNRKKKGFAGDFSTQWGVQIPLPAGAIG